VGAAGLVPETFPLLVMARLILKLRGRLTGQSSNLSSNLSFYLVLRSISILLSSSTNNPKLISFSLVPSFSRINQI
jgi:hypothetical protein